LLPLALALASGVLYALVFPPAGLAGGAWFALVPLLALLRRAGSAARGLLLGGAFGLGAATLAVSWLPSSLRTGFGMAAWQAGALSAGLIVYTALWFGLFGALAARLRGGWLSPILALPAAWTAAELGRERLGDGLPWLLLGHSQHQSIQVLQLAELGGAAAVAAVLVAANACWLEALVGWWAGGERAGRRASGFAALGLGLVAAAHLGGTLRLASFDALSDGPPVRMALIQAAVPQGERWVKAFRERNLERQLELTREAVAGGAELVVWSETSVDFVPDDLAPILRRVAEALGGDPDRELVLGVSLRRQEAGRERYTNAAILVGGDGAVRDSYDKIELLPIAESNPQLLLRIPGVRAALAPMLVGSPYTPGTDSSPLAARLAPAGVMICFETSHPHLGRASVERGAKLFLNLSNDAYFSTPGALEQHFAHAVFRAVESRRPLVRVANRGVGAVVEASGRVSLRVEPEQVRAVVVEVAPRSGSSLFLEGGFALPWLATALALAGLWRRRP
jgi:apolipoprotein N-acyltransferase